MDLLRTRVISTGLSQESLRHRLALAVGRPRPWVQSRVSRFLRDEHVTADIAHAFRVVFGLPPFVYFPEDMSAALELEGFLEQRQQRDGREI